MKSLNSDHLVMIAKQSKTRKQNLKQNMKAKLESKTWKQNLKAKLESVLTVQGHKSITERLKIIINGSGTLKV